MSNMRAIRGRIRSVQSTQQITKAMKMVAVAKLRRTQAAMPPLRDFAERTQQALDALGVQEESPFLTPRKTVSCVCYVLFVGNRGLCGVYNSAVLRYLEGLVAGETRACSVVVCGRWGTDALAGSTLNVARVFSDFSDTPTMDEALELSDYLQRLYLSGEADEIYLVYQHYCSALRQEPAALRLLPAAPETRGAAAEDTLFEPDRATILDNLLRLYLNSTVHSVMLEARVGEHAARMTAMTAATDSTTELIDELRLRLNRARQAAITTEISEIVGGASAQARAKAKPTAHDT